MTYCDIVYQMLERLTLNENSGVFTESQRDLLQSNGYKIFRLRGETISQLIANGSPFASIWHRGLEIEMESSKQTEVALKTDNPFMPNTGSKPFSEQLVLLEKYNDELVNTLPDMRAVVGSAADYVELDVLCRQDNGRSIYRRAGNSNYAVTSSVFENHQIFVGGFYDGSIIMSYRFGDKGDSDMRLVPLIVPLT